MTQKLYLSCVALIILCHCCLLYHSAAIHSPTWDEPGHFVSGISHWELRRFNLYSVNPPLVRLVASAPAYWSNQIQVDWSSYNSDPVNRSEVLVGRRFMDQHAENAVKAIVGARRSVILFSLLGAVIIARWAGELWGVASSLSATALWCFSPTVLGHGALITPDVGAAATFLAAAYGVWRWLQSPNWTATCWMALAIWCAISTKTTNWVTFPAAILLWWLQRRRLSPVASFSLLELTQLLAALFAATLAFNLLYGFRGTNQRLGDYSFASEALGGTVEGRGNRFQGTLVGPIPIPLPFDFVSGIDIQKRDIERGLRDSGWRSYLWGEWHQGGWAYFYLVATLLKESLGTLILMGAGIIVLCAELRRSPHAQALLIPVLAVFGFVSSQSAFTMHYRYVLPALPFLYLIAGSVVAHALLPIRLGAWGLVACSIFGSMFAYPHSLSHFNIAAGVGAKGENALVDSNVDWGQDLLLLRGWLDAHPEAKSLKMVYFGSFDPRSVGVDYKLPQPLPANVHSRPLESQKGLGPQPGWCAVSVNHKQGCMMPVPDGSGHWRYFGEPVFSYFKEFRSCERIGGSIEVFHLEVNRVNIVRKKLGLPPVD